MKAACCPWLEHRELLTVLFRWFPPTLIVCWEAKFSIRFGVESLTVIRSILPSVVHLDSRDLEQLRMGLRHIDLILFAEKAMIQDTTGIGGESVGVEIARWPSRRLIVGEYLRWFDECGGFNDVQDDVVLLYRASLFGASSFLSAK